MSPASYLTAPPRGEAGIVAAPDTIGGVWNWVVWAALAIAVAAGIASLVRLAIVGLRFWRELKRTQRAVFAELDALAARAEAVGERAAALGGGSERLSRSLARLAVSRRRLNVLRQAIDEVTDAVGTVTAVYPRK